MASSIALLCVCFIQAVRGQGTYDETIWSSVIVTRYGDRIPEILPENTVITPLGAQQLYSTGQLFRDRYINSTSNLAIPGISTLQMDYSQVFAFSLYDGYVLSSAQAFLQGLYPPLGISNDNSTNYNTISLLSNGSNVVYPLDGYQYQQIYTASPHDPEFIWLAGYADCPAYQASGQEYFSSPEYFSTYTETATFFASLSARFFGGELPNASVNDRNAYYIFDYLNYGFIHNSSIHADLSEADLRQVQDLADTEEFALNGNLTASGFVPGDRIRAIAGRTLAAEILGLLDSNIESVGVASKLNLLFTSFEPMISLASLFGLPDLHPQFFGLPAYGSSMVFELFSSGSGNTTNPPYPNPSQLQVRFLFRNGTNNSQGLDTYPIFGTDFSMTFTDFTSQIMGIMLDDIGVWCQLCGSAADFCTGYVNSSVPISTPSSSVPSSSSSHTMKPAIAGLIGALVALAVAALVLLVAMLVGGVRFTRSKTKRRSELGGFKGAEKLASDTDLTVPKGGMGASVVKTEGLERPGSWELAQKKKAEEGMGGFSGEGEGRPSFEADGESIRGVPVKADERV